MSGVEYFSAVFLGTIASRLLDPLAWIMIVAMIVCGYLRTPSLIAIPAGGVVASIVNVAIVWTWWRQIGVAWQSRIGWMVVSYLVIAAIAYGIGRLAVRMFGAKPTT